MVFDRLLPKHINNWYLVNASPLTILANYFVSLQVFGQSLKMCMRIFCNPQINTCHIFVDWTLSKHIDTGSCERNSSYKCKIQGHVNATPPTSVRYRVMWTQLLLQVYTECLDTLEEIFLGVRTCMWFRWNMDNRTNDHLLFLNGECAIVYCIGEISLLDMKYT